MLATLLCLLQGSLPTVGDTIWLERSVVVPPGAEVRAAPWDPEGDVSLLGRPVVRREGSTATVAYPAVAWQAGIHTVLVPGPVVIGRDGVTDSLPIEARTIEVRSVLPSGQPVEQLPIQPQTGLVTERITSLWPPLVAWLVAAGLFTPLAWWWRRRGRPVEIPRPTSPGTVYPFAEWAEDGEARAVAAAAARALRTAIQTRLPGGAPGVVTSRLIRMVQEQRPAWPSDEIGMLLKSLEAAQYAEGGVRDIVSLAERAGQVRQRLEGAA